jgi:hypothetical protein
MPYLLDGERVELEPELEMCHTLDDEYPPRSSVIPIMALIAHASCTFWF